MSADSDISEMKEVFRTPGLLLMVAIYSLPLLCCWLTLRRGYRPSFRVAVFTYTVVATGVGLLGVYG